MKQLFFNAGTFIMVTAFTFVINSCQDFDPTNEEVYVKTSYEKNFKSTFGEIDPNQCWDLTKTMPRTAKYDISRRSITRAADGYTDATDDQINDIIDRPDDITQASGTTDWANSGWYKVQIETINWMDNILKEGEKNTSKGSPFSLVPPANKFAIIPIYQGDCGMNWDLHLVDMKAGIDYKIWTQSEGIWMYRDNKWSKPGLEWPNIHTMNAEKIYSRPIIIDNAKIQGEFFLYLEITKGQTINEGGYGDYAETGTLQRSDDGMMLSLSCPIPNNLEDFTDEDGSLVMIVGCEDADMSGSDWDLNDVVFLIVGYPLVPDIIEHYYKRYLCEDLGNTFDFDFNDIVVDVEQESYFRAKLDDNNEVIREEEVSLRKQYATISHLCGTLPFVVTMGNYSFPVVTDPTDETKTKTELAAPGTTRANDGWEPNETKDISGKGFNLEENNISIMVKGNSNESVFTEPFGYKPVEEDSQEHIYKITFPGNGDVPFIIAVDQTVGWTREFEHIPESWWKISTTNP